MIRMTQRDDFVISGIAAGGQNRGFIRLRAAVGEKALGQLAAGSKPGDAFGKRGLRLRGEHGGDVLKRVDLRGHFPVHRLIAMSHADGDDAAEEVQVLVAASMSQTN